MKKYLLLMIICFTLFNNIFASFYITFENNNPYPIEIISTSDGCTVENFLPKKIHLSPYEESLTYAVHNFKGCKKMYSYKIHSTDNPKNTIKISLPLRKFCISIDEYYLKYNKRFVKILCEDDISKDYKTKWDNKFKVKLQSF